MSFLASSLSDIISEREREINLAGTNSTKFPMSNESSIFDRHACSPRVEVTRIIYRSIITTNNANQSGDYTKKLRYEYTNVVR